MKLFKKRMTKRSKVIVACLLNITILSFSLIMFLSSPTISWYISKTKDQTEFMNIGVKDCYDFEINVNKSKLLYWDVNNNCAVLQEGEIDNLTLNSYDTFITTRNVHNARYVCLELEFLNHISAGTYIKIDLSCVGNFVKEADSKKYVDNQISNVCQFKFKENDVDTVVTSINSATDMYNNFKYSFSSVSPKSFVNDPDITKENCKTKSITENSVQILGDRKPGDKMYVAFEFDYSVDLVTYFNSHCQYKSGSDIEFIQGNTINLEADVNDICFGTYGS